MGIAIYRFQERIILSKCQKSSLGYERFSILRDVLLPEKDIFSFDD